MKLRTFLLLFILLGVLLFAVRSALFRRPVLAAPANAVTLSAVDSVNALGIDLLHQVAQPDANALLSPYSIQMALVMTCAGAGGQTRDEIIRALHYPKDEAQLNRTFTDLQTNINGITDRESALAQQRIEQYKEFLSTMHENASDLSEVQFNATNKLLTLTSVNRLYGQSGYGFRPDYLKLLKDDWQSSFESVNFKTNASGITTQINSWVQDQTHGRIKSMIPAGALGEYSRLVLVNALYLKAPWLMRFSPDLTRPGTFQLADGTVIHVPIMSQAPRGIFRVGYVRREKHSFPACPGYTVITLPYECAELQFVILMPEKYNELPALEATLTPELLADCTNLPLCKADLSLPKFKLAPASLSLIEALKTLGIKSAFDESANFDRITFSSPATLYISGFFHQTFLQLDELGTEASAGTGLVHATRGINRSLPIQVKIDHPFLFMIQHRPTGACLFLGRLTDPR